MHLPKLALVTRSFGSMRSDQSVLVNLRQRKMTKDDSNLLPYSCSICFNSG